MERDLVAQPGAGVAQVFARDDVERHVAPLQAECDEWSDGAEAAWSDRRGDQVRRADSRADGGTVGDGQRAHPVHHALPDARVEDEAHPIAPGTAQAVDRRPTSRERQLVPGRVQQLANETAADPAGTEDDRPHASTCPVTAGSPATTRSPAA
jgi:hypothetical protein